MAQKIKRIMLYTDSRLSALGVLHGTTDKTAGNMRTAEATQALFARLNIPENKILRFKQIHSDRVQCISSLQQAQQQMQTPLLEADGWVLSGHGFGAAILTADCVPLLLWDRHADIVGIAHCGWRGTATGLPGKMVQHLKQLGAQGPLCAWVGPHIQSCCFEVKQEVAEQFPQAVLQRGGRLFVDLNQAINQQLLKEGLRERDIVCTMQCTCCQPEHFFSFRRDHIKDAQLTFVYKP